MNATGLPLDRRRIGGVELEPALLRPGEAARLLGVSRSRVYELIREGEIPAIRLAGTIRVPLAELRAMIASRASGGAE